jgi:IMP dehydrogenase
LRFLHPERDTLLELSLEDVFIVPNRFDGVSRQTVDLTPADFLGGSHPLVSSNMNAVTGKRMAETVARYGGLGVLPQDMSLETMRRIIAHIKNAHIRFDTALSVTPDATLRDVHGIARKRDHDMVVVVDSSNKPIGVVTPADWRNRDQYTSAGAAMSQQVVALQENTSNKDAYLLMEKSRVKAAPVVNAAGTLVGILTKEDAVRFELLRPSLDKNGKLLVAAAVGISADSAETAAKLVEYGADVIVLDTAHGHQRRMLEAIKSVRQTIKKEIPVIAGNVCTEEGTRELLEAGADVIKVNVGPGAMCTTRMQTGVGRPTFSAALSCATEAKKYGKHIWADGGVKHPRDVALYLAAGASRVMIGTMLAGTYESPGELKEDARGHLYKENYGMASARAVYDRTAQLDPFERAKKSYFREGVSSAPIYLRDGFESVGSLLIEILTGIQSSFTYVGANNINEFFQKVCVGVQTAGGYQEGTPHGLKKG